MPRKHSERSRVVHIALLRNLIQFCHEQGIRDWNGVVEARLRETIDQPLWKLLELEGKYHSEFISEGVLNIEQITGERVTPSSGKWKEATLRRFFPVNDPGRDLSSLPDFRCQLEHVIPRKLLVEQLITKQISVEELVDQHLLGCVVLGSEHRRLGAEVMALDDPWHKYRNANPPVRVWSRTSSRWVSD